MNISTIREAMLDAYAAGVAAVEGERVTEAWLRAHPPGGGVAMIALGKAAGAMALGAQRALREALISGLVITKPGHADAALFDSARIRVCEGAHPMPDESSLAAGRALQAFIAGLPPDRPVLVLVSGGASALVEVLRPGITLDDLARVNAWLLASGLPIGHMNTVRRRLSRIKGGGLAGLLAGRQVTGLMISDVEGDDPAVIGSGPLTVPADTDLPAGLPDWLRDCLPPVEADAQAPESKPEIHLVATLDHALAAAERRLHELGVPVERHTQHFDAELDEVVGQIDAALQNAPGRVHLWGGESTVRLPAKPGRGGRNQQLALSLALRIAGDHPAVVLSAGTDGTDGPTDDAGAVVDNRTCERGRQLGRDPAASLRAADAGSFLAESGDLVCTGPTGTNVTDLVMAWRGD